ncbi:hypothetical protein BH11MYX1_BH11MYX1_48720 [soil metagenome]
MGFALLYMVTRGSASVAAVSNSGRVPAPVAAPAAPAGVPEPARAPVAVPARHATTTAAPTLAPEAPLAPKRDGLEKPKHLDTPTDKLRWSLMRAIRATEPAVVECLNQAKQAGANTDGVSSYFFYVKRSGDRVVYDGAETEVSPYADPFKACLQSSAKDAVVDALPDDVQRVQVLRRLTIEHGDIAVYKLGAFHIIEPAP